MKVTSCTPVPFSFHVDSDLGFCAATLITLLKLFSFNDCEVDFDACLIQMFFIHVFFSIESGIFFTVVVDN